MTYDDILFARMLLSGLYWAMSFDLDKAPQREVWHWADCLSAHGEAWRSGAESFCGWIEGEIARGIYALNEGL